MELSQGTKKLLEQYQLWYQELQPKEAEAVLSVDEVAASVASFYEKIRGVVDWREEHLLRKTAIERIFKRRVLFAGDQKDFAEAFLQELIRGGHLPNKRVPVSMVETVQVIVNKYVFLHDHVESKDQKDIKDWILTIGACKIEEIFSNPRRERALIECMSQDMATRVFLRKKDEAELSDEDRKLHIEIAVQRALFKLDEATISLHLLEKFYPQWHEQPIEARKRIEKLLHDAVGERFYQVIERLDTPYLLLGDLMTLNPNDFSRLALVSAEFEETLKKAYYARLKKLEGRMGRAAFFSTVSVFLSKVLIALSLEVPFDKYVVHEFNLKATALSIAIPPLFLLFLVLTVTSSSEENLQKVLLEIMKITYETERKDRHEVAFPKRKKKGLVSFIVKTVYLATFFVSFGAVAWGLIKLQFTLPSILIFLFFFSLVAFAGTKIRQRSRELMILEQKEGFLSGLFDFFTLPIVQTGKWFSGKLARYNVLVVMLNVLIEAPFQVFVEFIEQLRNFWKEKKEEIH
ncbi:MAG: hypothetical protein Greene071421_150 [Parcubacteria group bacterium Greene0714_21]|nr:MAG: hypothetical protein Greene041639_202 [Parcubacteria group bacterium Greene0416_39]TSC98553.1 MAG: hypothetical protein Greene101447_55 [Parcubacteria group bacterium Greene1014_47]TSD04314.1 MAG: hypothetical protein Greene071421_150 [Parcubacteria group bacterium Greene0714_21]